MNIFALIALTILSPISVRAEWPVVDGVSPDGSLEFVTIPIFETDPPNGTPYRIALKDKIDGKLLDSFLWEGDMGDATAHRENKAFWSPNNRFVAIYMRSGRLSSTTAYFMTVDKQLTRLRPPDVWQNILGRYKTTEYGPNGGISPIAWRTENELVVEAFGSADTPEGRIPFHYEAVIQFEGDRNVVPYTNLLEARPKNTSEQGAAANP